MYRELDVLVTVIKFILQKNAALDYIHLSAQLLSIMAEGEDVEWELCKENIQPLRRGRNMSALLQALSQSKVGLSPAILQQRQYECFE